MLHTVCIRFQFQRKILRDFFNKNKGVLILFNPSKDVICAPGSKELIYLTLNALETTVIILTPAWPTYLPQARLANKKILLVERKAEDLWKLRADILEDTLKKNPVEPKSIMIFTNPDNPS